MFVRLTTRRVLPLILVWALLLCHGAFGSLHVVADTATAAPASGERAVPAHAPGHHHGAGHEGRQTDHAATEYFAVLLGTVFVGMALFALLRDLPRREETASATRRSKRIFPALSSLPRGPTLPILQVFRL